MKIFVTGTRGIPDIPGGVEKHCQELYPRIAAQGHEVLLATRSPYVRERRDSWQGVRLVHLFAPRRKSLEAIVHTLLAVLRARIASPDIVHIHAVGPSLMAPLARFLGLRVVVTNHGPDYARQKWGRLAKGILRLGESLGARWAHSTIAISHGIRDALKRRYRCDANLIHNGVPLPQGAIGTDHLDRLGLAPRSYLLAVARFVPEKGLHHLIEAFASLPDDTSLRLVIAGDADHRSAYSARLKEMAAADRRIVLPGYITGEPLEQLFAHARLFVLPSYHEGLPIALLEAMSYGLDVLASDIEANLEVELGPSRYFRCGDSHDLAAKMEALLAQEMSDHERRQVRQRIADRYDWQKIALQTMAVYEKVAARGSGLSPAAVANPTGASSS